MGKILHLEDYSEQNEFQGNRRNRVRRRGESERSGPVGRRPEGTGALIRAGKAVVSPFVHSLGRAARKWPKEQTRGCRFGFKKQI